MTDNYCEQQRARPASRFKLCNAHSCRYEWQMSRWSECNGCVQMRNVWCGHERPEWNEQPAHVDDKECLNISKKPEMVKQCEDNEGAREMREAGSDKVSKCLKIFMLKSPDVKPAVMSENIDNESEDTEIENTAGSAEILPTTTMRLIDEDNHSSRPEFFIIHRFHPLVNHHSTQERRKYGIEREQQQRNKMEHKVIEEIPIFKHQYRAVRDDRDDAYRALDDMVSCEVVLCVWLVLSG